MTKTTKDLLARLAGFTPGPWIVDNGTLTAPIEVSKCLLAHFSKSDDEPKHRSANTALIAAAPDLHRIATEQAAEIAWLFGALATAQAHAQTARDALECDEPEYHDQGMGCGLEDRNITDRYEAMAFGWEQAMERVYGEVIIHALAMIQPTPTTPALRALSKETDDDNA
jgi:hypothetical protein